MAVSRLTLVGCIPKFSLFGCSELLVRSQLPSFNVAKRNFNNIPLAYASDGKDPAPLFFSQRVQKLLRYVTRPDLTKVFRKRTNKGDHTLSTPEYRFLTDEQLQEELNMIPKKVDRMLQMPPVVKVYTLKEGFITKDPALTGHDSSKFVFTDITYGIKDGKRTIVVREPDGTLTYADNETRKRLNQLYFPMVGRQSREPAMFTDDTLFKNLLNQSKYIFILDRACLQYDPDNPTFQHIQSKVFEHTDEQNAYDLLRSTRHFGPMAFYFAWHNTIDGLMLDILRAGEIREGASLIALQRLLHPEMALDDSTKVLVDEILALKPAVDSNLLNSSEINVELDEKCMNCIDDYIQNNSSKKAPQELALQAFRQLYREKLIVDQGVRLAHGTS